MKVKDYSELCLNAARWSGVVVAISIAFSTAVTNIFSILATVLWLISGKAGQQFKMILKHPATPYLLGLLMLLVVSVIGGSADKGMVIEGLKKYRKLLYFFVFLAIYKDSEIWVNRILTAVFASTLLLAFGCVCVALGMPGFPPMDPYQGAILMKHHITQGFLLSVLFLLGMRYLVFFSDKRMKALGLFGMFMACLVTLYLSNGRTGYVSILIAIFASLLWLFKSNKQRIVTVLLVGLLALGVVSTSDRIKMRIQHVQSDIAEYSRGNAFTSIGLRFLFWTHSVDMIKEKPILGVGVGSWGVEFCEREKDRVPGTRCYWDKNIGNAHNDFLMYASQAGLLALALWLIFMFQIWRAGQVNEVKNCRFLEGFLMVYLGGCLFNSYSWDITEGSLGFLLFATLSASYIMKNTSKS